MTHEENLHVLSLILDTFNLLYQFKERYNDIYIHKLLSIT